LVQVGRGVKVVETRKEKVANHRKLELHLLVDMAVTKHQIIIATVLHKTEELVHHYAGKVLNDYHRAETIHHIKEMEVATKQT